MTGGQIVLVVVIGVIFLGLAAGIGFCESVKVGLIACGAVVAVMVLIVLAILWFNNNTASGIRRMKDWRSERENGIEREIIIHAEDGRQIFYYKGKVDVELDHNDNYIKFEAEDGRRFIIVYGVQDTVEIIEVRDNGTD